MVNNEQEAAAGLYSLLTANKEDGTPDQATATVIEQTLPSSTPSPCPDTPEGAVAVAEKEAAVGAALSSSTTTTAAAAAAAVTTTTTDDTIPLHGPEDVVGEAIPDTTPEGMLKLTEMLLSNRPVVDPFINQGIGIVTPHPHDILSGRGNGANQHPGNIYFRNLILKYKHHYIHTGPSEKKLITKKIVQEVQSRNPPGRFMKQNPDNELYDCLDIDKVLKKTGQALREKAPELKKKAKEESKTRVSTGNNAEPSFSPFNFHTTDIIFNNGNGDDSHSMSMSFPMQNGTLDALAYQTIPLSSPTVHNSGHVNNEQSFNMTHLAAITNQVLKIDPMSRKKTEMLIEKATDTNTSLSQVFDFLKSSPEVANAIQAGVSGSTTSMSTPQRIAVQKGSTTGAIIPNTTAIFGTPHAHDVLFNNGIIVASHPGSQFFCEKVNFLLSQYKDSITNEKRLEQQIIASIGSRWPPGRFLCAVDHTCTVWQPLSFDQALHATSTHFKRALIESKQRIIIPDPRDVLLIRGNSHHQGNVFFRTSIDKHTSKVNPKHIIGGITTAGSATLCKNIARQIVKDIESNGGRFLKFNHYTNFWEQLDYDTMISKTLQAMKDFCKKKESQLKAMKKPATGIFVPALSFTKEKVEGTSGRDGKKCDPPGVFYNYYSNCHNGDGETLAISLNSNDPPGQVPTVIKNSDSGRKTDHHSNQHLIQETIEHYPDITVTVNEKRKMSDEVDGIISELKHDYKRIRLEP